MKITIPPPDNIIRACELKVGSIFRKQGIIYRVNKIKDTRLMTVYYNPETKVTNDSHQMAISINSKERIELIKL